MFVCRAKVHQFCSVVAVLLQCCCSVLQCVTEEDLTLVCRAKVHLLCVAVLLQCIVVLLQCVCCGVLQCVATEDLTFVCRAEVHLLCVAVCVAVCVSVLCSLSPWKTWLSLVTFCVLQCCCSVLQCVAVCVLWWVAVRHLGGRETSYCDAQVRLLLVTVLLQCVAVCVLLCVAVHHRARHDVGLSRKGTPVHVWHVTHIQELFIPHNKGTPCGYGSVVAVCCRVRVTVRCSAI